MDEFEKQKRRCLSAKDNSIKGSIDVKISNLVQLINESNDYFTTSSCSGRIMIFRKISQLKSKNCESLFVTHDSITEDDVQFLLDTQIEDTVIFKFEPFVLHVQCRTIDHARLLLKAALTSGFRNSGIVFGKKERMIVAVRSTQTLELPLTSHGTLLISSDYLRYILQVANEKLAENDIRIQKFEINLSSMSEEVTKKKKSKRSSHRDERKSLGSATTDRTVDEICDKEDRSLDFSDLFKETD